MVFANASRLALYYSIIVMYLMEHGNVPVTKLRYRYLLQ